MNSKIIVYTDEMQGEVRDANSLILEWDSKHDRLKELLTIKRNAEVILEDDSVNNGLFGGKKPRYTHDEVKAAQEAFSNAVKETDEIISRL